MMEWNAERAVAGLVGCVSVRRFTGCREAPKPSSEKGKAAKKALLGSKSSSGIM